MADRLPNVPFACDPCDPPPPCLYLARLYRPAGKDSSRKENNPPPPHSLFLTLSHTLSFSLPLPLLFSLSLFFPSLPSCPLHIYPPPLLNYLHDMVWTHIGLLSRC